MGAITHRTRSANLEIPHRHIQGHLRNASHPLQRFKRDAKQKGIAVFILGNMIQKFAYRASGCHAPVVLFDRLKSVCNIAFAQYLQLAIVLPIKNIASPSHGFKTRAKFAFGPSRAFGDQTQLAVIPRKQHHDLAAFTHAKTAQHQPIGMTNHGDSNAVGGLG